MKDDEEGSLDYIVKGNRQKVQFILFFNKILTDVETRYWLIKLEVACLV